MMPPSSSPAGQPQGPAPSQGSHRQTLYIAVGIVAAVLVAVLLPYVPSARLSGAMVSFLDLGGEIFLRLLKMVVVPLVITSVMSGILGLGDIRKLGRPGLRTAFYYLATTLLAVVLGIILVNAIRPGVGFDRVLVDEARRTGQKEIDKKLPAPKGERAEPPGGAEGAQRPRPEDNSKAAEKPEAQAPQGIGLILKNLVLMLFTDNLLKSMVDFDLLPLIAFSIVFAALLTTLRERAEPITRLVLAANDALLSFVLLLMKLAPVGIFCLVAARFGKAQLEGSFAVVLQQTFYFVLAVLAGLAIHACLTLPLILYLFTRRNPYRFMLDMMQALLTAFSTASSSATLPVTMECAEDKAKVARRSVDFVLPLGATVNMDGTALYEACAAMFIAQAIGMDLSLLQQATIALTATLAAIGAAGIPQAGLVTMVIVLGAVGLPVELIGLVLPVDWFLDRFRTAVNVFGDAVGAAVVERSFVD